MHARLHFLLQVWVCAVSSALIQNIASLITPKHSIQYNHEQGHLQLADGAEQTTNRTHYGVNSLLLVVRSQHWHFVLLERRIVGEKDFEAPGPGAEP